MQRLKEKVKVMDRKCKDLKKEISYRKNEQNSMEFHFRNLTRERGEVS